MTDIEKRVKAFRRQWPNEIEGHLIFRKELKAEIEWLQTSPPSTKEITDSYAVGERTLTEMGWLAALDTLLKYLDTEGK